ncbi:hypothetical protein EV652_11626 [Kribbella steppae]|uniref:Uncharacterized protein n=1 Tax=Kribbella steppae TaxID=2512223 RepID=A0A4R2H0Z6_9ACTN|nr:hypothetical protein [Kribbella steppae]TCO18005.1 hypothetical protein EV652_11626 [Kribbella steppae]
MVVSKTQLYEAVLADVGEQLRVAIGHPDHAAPDSLPAPARAVKQNPDGFRLFFRQGGQEPELRAHADELRAAMKATAEPYLKEMISDPARLRWATDLVPAIAEGSPDR